MIKAVFFDIDGTLIPFENRILPNSTRQTLLKLHERGIKLFISTGRAKSQLSLLPKDFQDLPWDGMVLMNGQCVIDQNGTYLRLQAIDRECIRKAYHWLSTTEYPIGIMEQEISYDIRFNPAHINYYEAVGDIMTIQDPSRILEHDIYQIMVWCSSEEDEFILKHLYACKSERWTNRFTDIIPEEGGKNVGMKVLADHYGIELSECAAFGDGENDISMLKSAGIGIAMGNGSEEVKKAADMVTDACDQDGIRNACLKLSLI